MQLKRVLDANRISQSKLARALGVDRSSVSRWLSGERRMDQPTVTKTLVFLSRELARSVTYEEAFLGRLPRTLQMAAGE